MKIFVEYEKETQEWVSSYLEIPKTFTPRIDKKSRNVDYNSLRKSWIEEEVKDLKSKDDVRNITVDEDHIYYESFDTEYDDVEEVLEINTLEELLEAMKKFEVWTLYKDDEDKNRWKLGIY